VSDPESPRLAGGVVWPGLANGVIVSEGHAYVVDASARPGLQVIDVRRPDRPDLAGRHEGRVSADFSISAGHAFVAGGGGLAVLSLSDPRNPRRTGFHASLVEAVLASDGYAHATGFSAEFQVIDVSRPDSPRRVGGYLQETGVYTAFSVSGSRAYVANRFGQGLEVLDIGDPENPRRAGGNPVLDGHEIQQVFAAEGAVFVAAGYRGLVILDEFQDATAGAGRFLRGEANDDGAVNPADAVFTLNWLFLDGAGPGLPGRRQRERRAEREHHRPHLPPHLPLPERPSTRRPLSGVRTGEPGDGCRNGVRESPRGMPVAGPPLNFPAAAMCSPPARTPRPRRTAKRG
jgi:hypothetical protein